MRPASRTNLSFHSSSDMSGRAIFLDDNASSPAPTPGGRAGPAKSQTVSPMDSEALRSAISATPSAGMSLASPPHTARRPATTHHVPELPASRQPSMVARTGSAAVVSSASPKRPPSSAVQRAKSAPSLPADAAQTPTTNTATAPAQPTPAKGAAAAAAPSGGGWWNNAKSVYQRGRGAVDRLVGRAVDPAAAEQRNRAGADESAAAASPSSGVDALFADEERSPLSNNNNNAAHTNHSPYDEPEEEEEEDRFSPQSSVPNGPGSNTGGSRPPRYGALRVERVVLDPSHQPFDVLPPMAHPIQEVTEEEQLLDEATDVDAEPPVIEVDLVSALHGYCENPNECYGHLVAAALTSRSAERPVTGAELAEARHNPYLVRLILDSDCLDINDPAAQQNVQETLDRLFPNSHTEITPELHEYLAAFFRMPFVKLSHDRYVLLKSSGFENLSLMYQYQHVLPDERFQSIRINYSRAMSNAAIFFLVLGLLATTCCTVSIALVLARWMTIDHAGYQKYGFYTLIAFGCGYAARLIIMVYIMRKKENELVYEDPQGLSMPSAYVDVVPAFPLFEIYSLVTYIRSLPLRQLAFSHNVLAASRLDNISYALCFAFPQLIVQSFFNHSSHDIEDAFQNDWSYVFLRVTTIVQWSVALLRFMWMELAYDSISGLGFARFNIRPQRHSIRRHSGVVVILFYIMLFVAESSIYVIVAACIEMGSIATCKFLPIATTAVSGATTLVVLVVYVVLIFTGSYNIPLSFAAIPVVLLIIASFILSGPHYGPDCVKFDRNVFRNGFVFGYISWVAYFAIFVLWMLLMLFWLIYGTCGISCFPRLTWPIVRRRHRDTDDANVSNQEQKSAANNTISSSTTDSSSSSD